MKYVLWGLGAVALYFVLGYTMAALGIAALPLFTLQTKINANYGIVQKTYNADNQIYNYHWFKETEGSINALATQTENAQLTLDNFEKNSGERSTWTFEDKTEDSRLRAIVLGLKNQRESLIREYDARASEADRSIFKDGLKTYIPLD